MRGRREEELASHAPSENGLGTTIRAWRRFHGLTVTDLAVEAGFGKNGRGYISRIEHGQIKHLGEERLQRIATTLHVQQTDLLLYHLPETQGNVLWHDLDEAIIGGKALLKECREKSLDWARLQLLMAKLYHEQATASQTTAAKYAAFIEAQRCLAFSLLVFTASTTPQSFQEATRLRQDIDAVLDTWIIMGGKALLKRCPPQSNDWARIQLLLAKFYCDRATMVQDQAARAILIKAQQCLEAALPIFTQKQAQRSLKEVRQLQQEIAETIGDP